MIWFENFQPYSIRSDKIEIADLHTALVWNIVLCQVGIAGMLSYDATLTMWIKMPRPPPASRPDVTHHRKEANRAGVIESSLDWAGLGPQSPVVPLRADVTLCSVRGAASLAVAGLGSRGALAEHAGIRVHYITSLLGMRGAASRRQGTPVQYGALLVLPSAPKSSPPSWFRLCPAPVGGRLSRPGPVA